MKSEEESLGQKIHNTPASKMDISDPYQMMYSAQSSKGLSNSQSIQKLAKIQPINHFRPPNFDSFKKSRHKLTKSEANNIQTAQSWQASPFKGDKKASLSNSTNIAAPKNNQPAVLSLIAKQLPSRNVLSHVTKIKVQEIMNNQRSKLIEKTIQDAGSSKIMETNPARQQVDQQLREQFASKNQINKYSK